MLLLASLAHNMKRSRPSLPIYPTVSGLIRLLWLVVVDFLDVRRVRPSRRLRLLDDPRQHCLRQRMARHHRLQAVQQRLHSGANAVAAYPYVADGRTPPAAL